MKSKFFSVFDELFIAYTLWTCSIYYQHDPERISACPLTVHALLHIADSIKAVGPVWSYWEFPMERYCGTLQPAIRSRRFPYASLDRFVLESAQLTQIKAVYNCAEELNLRPPRGQVVGLFSDPLCMSYMSLLNYLYTECWLFADPSCVLLPPRVKERPTEGLVRGITAALATRFECRVSKVTQCLKSAVVEEWGKVRRIDSEAGDTMRCSSVVSVRDDTRDATYVRVSNFCILFRRI